MMMKKSLFLLAVVFSMFGKIWAGGLLTNTNQNVSFLRNPARDASTEIDAAYTNPAGLAFLSHEGFSLSINNQSAFQTRTTTSDYAPFIGFGGNPVKEFEGKAQALFVPNLQAAYKTGDWTFSANMGIVGGGGTLDFSKGLPSFESQVAGNVAALYVPLNTLPAYTLDSRLKGTQIIYGIQLGATYKFSDNFSAYIGGRASIVENKYEGYLRNVQIANKNDLTAYYTGAASMARSVVTSLQPAAGFLGNAPLSQLIALGLLQQAQLDQMAAGLNKPSAEVGAYTVNQTITTFNGLAQQADGAVAGINQLSALDMQVNCKQNGSGIAPIIGFDYNWNGLNIGAKYEFKTGLNVKNKTTINTTPVADFEDGVKTPYDIPALLAVGVKYDIIFPLTVSVGYHHFFDSDAKMAGGKQQYINGGINEYLAGVEYRISKMFLVSCGGQVTRTGVTNEYQSDMSFSLNSYSLGLGGAIDVTENIRINLAYFFTNYSDWTRPNNYSASVQGTDTFGRTNYDFGIGVDFKF